MTPASSDSADTIDAEAGAEAGADSGPAVVWFRRDLRLGDNPAWSAAGGHGPVTALFVVDPALFDRAGAFRRRQLVAHLRALDDRLRERGGRLRIEHGVAHQALSSVVADTGARAVFLNSDATPYSTRRDAQVQEALGPVPLIASWGTMVHEPGRVLTARGTLPMVFTPFFKVWASTGWAGWAEGPGPTFIAKDPGDEITDAGDAPLWQEGGEQAAEARLEMWQQKVDRYRDTHDVPSVDGTSSLSADLRYGTISPRRIADEIGLDSAGRSAFVRQLAWRDWYSHLLYEHPELPDAALKPEFDRIEWHNEPADIEAWRTGRTGYPLIDAGMRQLLSTGWMHNRVRMAVASFLVKDLLCDWRIGERWFRHLLVDADVSQNVGNWQWVAGTGPDAAPYFRIFNPVTQSQKFDPDGVYIRRFVPELANLAAPAIHAPWDAAPLSLLEAGVSLGEDYPEPIIDHRAARARTLAAFAAAKNAVE